MNKDHKYLGDGVYVSHDGYQLWLHLDSHHAEPLIALDRRTFLALQSYGTDYYGIKQQQREQDQ